MASGLQMPGNIEAAASLLSADQRYSIYTIVQNTIAQFSDVNPMSDPLAKVTDPTFPRHRPLIIQSEQIMPGRNFAHERAAWETARRIGGSQALRLTCDLWRDAAGQLWQPNKLASVDAPPHKLVGLDGSSAPWYSAKEKTELMPTSRSRRPMHSIPSPRR